ncbi:MAG: hypothetical protein ACYDA0_15095 [Candidatus Dormibacteraceae bacterium]
MSVTTEILIAAAIIGSMALQFGDHPATIRRLVGPLAIVVGLAFYYLKAIPTAGDDGLFALSGVALGAVLGILAAALMGVRRDGDGRTILSVGLPYIAFWVGVFGARIVFALVATNSPATLRQLFIYAYQHGITVEGWTAFFMLQAIAMVGVRTLLVGARALVVGRSAVALETEGNAA